jgi:hypothetical protein
MKREAITLLIAACALVAGNTATTQAQTNTSPPVVLAAGQ